MVLTRKKQNRMPRFGFGTLCAVLAAELWVGVLFGNPAAPPSSPAKSLPPLAGTQPVAVQGVVAPPPVKAETISVRKLFDDGQAALRSQKADDALEHFEKAAAQPPDEWSRRAALAAIRLIAQKGDWETAISRLDVFARRADAKNCRYRCETLALWLLASSGKIKEFQTRWQSFHTAFCPVPDAEVAEAVEKAYRLLSDAKDVNAATELLQQSLEYQTSDAARIVVLRREWGSCRTPAEIAAVADRYARWFPNMEETAKIQLYAADRLWSANVPDQAQKLWELVAGNRSYSAFFRELALESAAVAAEKRGDDVTARTMYQSLIAMTGFGFSPRLKFGEYLLRTGDLLEAEKIFRELWLSNDEKREFAGGKLLQVLIRKKKSEEALLLAAQLRNSASYGHYAEIKLAELQEETGDKEGARSTYQALLRHYPDDPYAGHIAYRIAFLAGELKLPGAIDEMFSFAAQYPADPRAPRALLRAMQFAGNADAAAPYFGWFVEHYDKDPLFADAVAQQFYFEMAAGHDAKVLQLQEKYSALLPDAQFGAFAGLAELRTLLARERWSEALTLGKSLEERYRASSAIGEIAFCCGNAESVLGNYAEALQNYERALKLRPAGKLGESAKGRVADMCYVLFGQTQKTEFLERAEKLYRELAEKSLSLPVKLTAYCQLGRTLELSGRLEESTDSYDKALDCAQTMKAGDLQPEAIWCYRAAYGAIRIRMRLRHRKAALNTAGMLESLALGDHGENFTALRRDIIRRKTTKHKR